jgi:hypothetical protein
MVGRHEIVMTVVKSKRRIGRRREVVTGDNARAGFRIFLLRLKIWEITMYHNDQAKARLYKKIGIGYLD